MRTRKLQSRFLFEIKTHDDMAKKIEGKTTRVTVRFTAKEWEEVRVQMQNNDYLSKASFIRDKVLNRRIKWCLRIGHSGIR